MRFLSGTKRTEDMVYIALGAVLIVVCTWISIPALVPFTLQTFAVYALLSVFGARRTLWALVIYCLLGVFGLPVFSGFSAGAGVLLGPTGGYIVGFFFVVLCDFLRQKMRRTSLLWRVGAYGAGLVLLYGFGLIWFMLVYQRGNMSFGAAFALCIAPFIIPDAIKIALAVMVGGRVKKALKV